MQMVATRYEAWGRGPALIQPSLDAPVRNRPARPPVAAPVIRRALRPSRLKPFRGSGQLRHAFGFRPGHGFRVGPFRSAVEVRAKAPPLQPHPVLDRRLRRADRDRAVFR
jgi:hypothetical protein